MTRRVKLGGALLLTLVVLLAGMLALWRWASRPADGTLQTKTPVVEQPDPFGFEAQDETVNVQNSYFSASLPAGFKVKRQTETPESPRVFQLAATNKHQQLAVTVATLSTSGLAGVGNYNLRVKNTTQYQPYSLEILPPAAAAFRATEGPPAFAAFWPYGDYYVEIALTSDGGATLDELVANFDQTIRTWQWR